MSRDPTDEDDSVDIARLRKCLSSPHEPQVRSPPIFATAPSNLLSGSSPQNAEGPSPYNDAQNGANNASIVHSTPTSHDRTGNLRLNYSIPPFSIPPYSQIDTGETQIDSNNSLHSTACQVRRTPEHASRNGTRGLGDGTQDDGAIVISSGGRVEATPEKPGPEADADFDILNDSENVEGSDSFPEASRFDTPGRPQYETPVRPKLGYNPLAGLSLDGPPRASEVTMSQLFGAVSSPAGQSPTKQQHRSSSLAPPTPAGAASMIMAKSFSRPATVLEENSPVPNTPCGKSPPPQPSSVPTEPLEKYVVIPESSPETADQSPWKGGGHSQASESRSRSASPVPLPTQTFWQRRREQPEEPDSDSDIVSDGEWRRAKAAAARRKGDAQVAKLLQTAATKRPPPNRPTYGKRRNRRSYPTPAQMREAAAAVEERLAPTQIVHDSPDDTGSPTQPDTTQEGDIRQEGNDGKTAVGAENGPLASGSKLGIQVPQSPPGNSRANNLEPLDKNVQHQTQPSPPVILDDDTWDRYHGGLSRPRRARSASALKTGDGTANGPEIDHTKSLSPPSKTADVPQGERVVPVTSLKQMVPFNISPIQRLPTPPRNPPPETSHNPSEIVRESSNLEPTSTRPTALLPSGEGHRDSTPPAAVNPASHSPLEPRRTPPLQDREVLPKKTPTHDRTTQTSSHGDDSGPAPGPRRERERQNSGQLQSFAAMDSSGPLFSSREEPEDVDMLGIVRSVGAGYQPELEIPTRTPVPKSSMRKRKKPAETPVAFSKATPSVPCPQIPIGGESLQQTIVVQSPPQESAVTESRSSSPPSAKRARPTVELANQAKEKLTKATKSGASSAKSLAKRVAGRSSGKTRVSTLRYVSSVSALPDSPSPAVGRPNEDDDDATTDILASNDPSFSISGSMDREPIVAQYRVFALFKDAKLFYHPATVVACESQTQLRVRFDDGTEDVLPRECVRTLDLRKGDVVKVDLPSMKKGVWVIRSFPPASIEESDAPEEGSSEFTDIRGHALIAVSAKKADPAADIVHVPVTKIYLMKTLWGQFSGRDATASLRARVLSPSSVSASISAAVTPSHAFRRLSTTPSFAAAANHGPRTGLFANMLFALTFHQNRQYDKQKLVDKILQHGGMIAENGFPELFVDMDEVGGREEGEEGERAEQALALRPEARNLGFTCVLADSHCRRPKFLQALALGLPCLAGKWVEDCVRLQRVLDWEPYLLPAGESAYLGTVRSRILPPFEAAGARLADVLARRKKLLGRRNVVVVVGKGNTDKRKVHTFLAHAQGAQRITAAKNLDAVRDALRAGADTLLVDRAERKRAAETFRGVGVLDEEEFIQALIFGAFAVGSPLSSA